MATRAPKKLGKKRAKSPTPEQMKHLVNHHYAITHQHIRERDADPRPIHAYEHP